MKPIFIELTRHEHKGVSITLAIHAIESISLGSNRATVITTVSGDRITVTQPYKDVLEIIRGALQ